MIGALFETNPKYELLEELLGDTLKNIKYSNNVNVIIDLKSIYRKAYRTDINEIAADQKIVIEDITSHIINMIGHYRNFLYKSGKYSTFYILYSTQECKLLQEIYPDYKKHYYDKYFKSEELRNINNIIKSVTNQIKILSKYIPNVFFIDTSEFDEFVYMSYLTRSIVNKNDINLLLTSDPILYSGLNKTTFSLDLKGQNTKLITNLNSIEYVTESSVNITCNLNNLLLSIAGDDLYSLNKLPGIGYKKALKMLKSLYDSNIIIDKTYMMFPKTQLSNNDILKENIDKIEQNFKVIFPIALQIENAMKLASAFNISKPKVTLNQFTELNQRIFLYYPINIISLLKGESI